MITKEKAWIVCRQFSNRGERFNNETEANQYAEMLARKIGGEIVEVFSCTKNLAAQIPVFEVVPRVIEQ